MSQIAVANQVRYYGIPDPTITFTGRSGSSRVLTIFNTANKSVQGEVASSNGNDGERQASRRTNDRVQFTCSAKPVGATAAAALDIAEDLPKLNTLCTIACTGDTQIATPSGGSSVIDNAETAYTPEGEAMINFTITNWIGKVFVAAS